MRVFLFKDEKGIAMVVVLGIMLILTTLAFAAVAISENDLASSSHDRDSTEALHIAEAGVQKALWQLEQFGNSMNPKTFTIAVNSGTAEVNAVQDMGQNWYWTIESTGTYGNARRKIKVTVFNFSMWNMNIATGSNKSLASGGNGILGTASVDGPFYVRGNIELSGNSSITGGPLFIKTGSLVLLNNSATLGLPGSPVSAFIEPVGNNGDIVDKDGLRILDNPNQSQVFLRQLSNQCPDIEVPPMDSLASYRNIAKSESSVPPLPSTYYQDASVSVDPNVSGGYKVLDDDGSVAMEDVGLRHTYHLDSSVSNFGSSTCGLGWDTSGGTKKLHVMGTVYIDGNLVIGDNKNDTVVYDGRGTLVVNGNITIKGKLIPASAGVMDSAHVLGLVTNEEITVDVQHSGGTGRDNPDIAGALFATKKVSLIQNNTTFVGSMIAGTLNFAYGTNNCHLYTDDSLPSFLPPSLPGSTKFMAMTASWREAK